MVVVLAEYADLGVGVVLEDVLGVDLGLGHIVRL
jgi:hypothetical protein